MKNIFVIGDSLSSTECSWARQFDRYFDDMHFQIDARPGRLLVMYDVPRDLWAQPGETAIVWLGGNDCGVRIPPAMFRSRAQDISFTLNGRGFEVVFCLPPAFTHVDPEPYRLAISDLFAATVIDPPWHNLETEDGIHLTPDAHGSLAGWFFFELHRIGVLQQPEGSK